MKEVAALMLLKVPLAAPTAATVAVAAKGGPHFNGGVRCSDVANTRAVRIARAYFISAGIAERKGTVLNPTVRMSHDTRIQG